MKRLLFAIGMALMIVGCNNMSSEQAESLMEKGDSLLDKKDSIGAYKCYKEVSDKGYAVGKFREVWYLRYGIGVEKDSATAQKMFKENIEPLKKDSKNVRAWRYLGHCYYWGYGVEKNDTEAVICFRKAAEQGDADAQFNLGMCYFCGNGIEKDYAQSLKWLTKAAGQGNVYAQFCLGMNYEKGYGTEKDYVEAEKWYKKAAEQGLADAQYFLGNYYYEIYKDYKRAIYCYKKAAEQGDARAQNSLGICYFNGYGVEKDYTEAVKWYRKAAENGNYEAIKTLSKAKELGLSISEEEAQKWAKKYEELEKKYLEEEMGF